MHDILKLLKDIESYNCSICNDLPCVFQNRIHGARISAVSNPLLVYARVQLMVPPPNSLLTLWKDWAVNGEESKDLTMQLSANVTNTFTSWFALYVNRKESFNGMTPKSFPIVFACSAAWQRCVRLQFSANPTRCRYSLCTLKCFSFCGDRLTRSLSLK